jgi:hypothetical protein
MKGTFETGEKITAFITPLKNLGDVMGDSGVVLNVDKEEKTINIYAINSSAGTLIYLKYIGGLFDNFTFADQEEKVGVLKLSEFVRYFSVLDDAGVSLEFEDNLFSIKHDGGALSFKTADPDVIKQAPKTFKGSTWFTEFEIDSRFSKLHKAMNVLANEDCLFVNGVKDTNKVTMTVKSETIDINSFKVAFDNPVVQDFNSHYRKDVLQQIFKTPSESIKVSFADRLAKFECKSKFFEMTYYLAKKVPQK